jgi:hypothetical protein
LSIAARERRPRELAYGNGSPDLAAGHKPPFNLTADNLLVFVSADRKLANVVHYLLLLLSLLLYTPVAMSAVISKEQ